MLDVSVQFSQTIIAIEMRHDIQVRISGTQLDAGFPDHILARANHGHACSVWDPFEHHRYKIGSADVRPPLA